MVSVRRSLWLHGSHWSSYLRDYVGILVVRRLVYECWSSGGKCIDSGCMEDSVLKLVAWILILWR